MNSSKEELPGGTQPFPRIFTALSSVGVKSSDLRSAINASGKFLSSTVPGPQSQKSSPAVVDRNLYAPVTLTTVPPTLNDCELLKMRSTSNIHATPDIISNAVLSEEPIASKNIETFKHIKFKAGRAHNTDSISMVHLFQMRMDGVLTTFSVASNVISTPHSISFEPIPSMLLELYREQIPPGAVHLPLTTTITLSPSEYGTTDLSFEVSLPIGDPDVNAPDESFKSEATDIFSNNGAQSTTAAGSRRKKGTNRFGVFSISKRKKRKANSTDSEYLSEKHAEAFLRAVIECVPALHARFYRGEEVDSATFSDFISSLSNTPPLDEEELKLISKSKDFLLMTGFQLLSGCAISNAKIWKRTDGGKVWTKSCLPIDAPATTVLAEIIHYSSHRRLRQHIKSDGHLPRYCRIIRGTHTSVVHNLKYFFQASNRLFESKMVWDEVKTLHGTCYYVAYEPLSPGTLHYKLGAYPGPRDQNLVLASARGIFQITPTSRSTCSFLHVSLIELGGKLPPALLTLKIRSSYKFAFGLFEHYERDGRSVDDEVIRRTVEHMSRPDSAHRHLNDEQRAFVEESKRLVDFATTGSQMLKIFCKSPFIKMDYRFVDGHRAYLIRTRMVLDAPPAYSAVWLSRNYVGRVRTKRAREQGDTARMLLEESTDFDMIFATAKRIWPLRTREFILRSLVAQGEEEGDLQVAVQSIRRKEAIDYGGDVPVKKIPGKAKFHFSLVSRNEGTQTAFTSLTFLYTGVKMPYWVVSKATQNQSSFAIHARKELQRDEEIDSSEREAFVRRIRRNSFDPYEANEALYRRVRVKFESILHLKWERSDISTDPLTNFEKVTGEKDDTAIGRASVVVDCDVDTAVSFERFKASRSAIKSHYRLGGSLVAVKNHSESCWDVCLVKHIGIPGITDREVFSRNVLKPSPEGFIIAAESITMDVDEIAKHRQMSKTSKMNFMSIFHFVRMTPILADVPRTRITLLVRLQDRNGLPSVILHRLMNDFLVAVPEIRLANDSGTRIEKYERNNFLSRIEERKSSLSKEENTLAEMGNAMFSGFVKRKISKKSEFQTIVKNGFYWGRSETIIKARKEEVLAYIWNEEARSRIHGPVLEREICFRNNEHNQVVRVITRRTRTTKNVFKLQAIWGESADKGSYRVYMSPNVMSEASATKNMKPENKRSLFSKSRATKFFSKAPKVDVPEATYHIRRYGNNDSKLILVARTRQNHHASVYFMNHMLTEAVHMKEYFFDCMKLEEWREGDASEIALAWLSRRKNCRGLNELSRRHEHVLHILDNVKTFQRAKAVKSRLFNLSRKEAKSIGGALSTFLVTSTLPEAAVDEWISRYPALIELDETYAWFCPMMSTIAAQLLGDAAWGVKLRVAIGGALTFLDIFTDVLIIIKYMKEPDMALLSMIMLLSIGVCSILSTAILLFNNERRPGENELRIEYLSALLGFSSIFTAFKVSSGKQVHPLQHFNPLLELTILKVIELVIEIVPSIILQIYAIFVAKERSSIAITSLIVSGLSTGYTSAIITYDMDVSTKKRRINPRFYGFIPEQPISRAIVFLAMVSISSSNVIFRGVSAALLIYTKPIYFCLLTGLEVAFYSSIKIARQDYEYWVHVEGLLRPLSDLIVRTLQVLVNDYVCILHLRHTNEIGGLLWSMYIVFNNIICFSIAALCPLPQGTDWSLTTMFLALSITQLVSLAVLIIFSRRILLYSLLDTSTMSNRIIDIFFNSTLPEAKLVLLTYRRSKWAMIEKQVKDYITSNWDIWMEDKPAWLTDHLKSKIPFEYLPQEVRMKSMKDLQTINFNLHRPTRRLQEKGASNSDRTAQVTPTLSQTEGESEDTSSKIEDSHSLDVGATSVFDMPMRRGGEQRGR